jgi:hypothetical protein
VRLDHLLSKEHLGSAFVVGSQVMSLLRLDRLAFLLGGVFWGGCSWMEHRLLGRPSGRGLLVLSGFSLGWNAVRGGGLVWARCWVLRERARPLESFWLWGLWVVFFWNRTARQTADAFFGKGWCVVGVGGVLSVA